MLSLNSRARTGFFDRPGIGHRSQFRRALSTLGGPLTNPHRGLVLRSFIVARSLRIYRVVATGFDVAGLRASGSAANRRERRR